MKRNDYKDHLFFLELSTNKYRYILMFYTGNAILGQSIPLNAYSIVSSALSKGDTTTKSKGGCFLSFLFTCLACFIPISVSLFYL